MKATAVHLIGGCNQETYPLQKKRHSLAYLRSIPHLRPRTNTFGAVTRVRSALAFATHQFFRESGFQYIHTPILSASDCEGAGEMFQVSFRTCMSVCLSKSLQHACLSKSLEHVCLSMYVYAMHVCAMHVCYHCIITMHLYIIIMYGCVLYLSMRGKM